MYKYRITRILGICGKGVVIYSLYMLRWLRGEIPRKRRGEIAPIKPNDLNYQIQKAEIAEEQAQAAKHKNFFRENRGSLNIASEQASNMAANFKQVAEKALSNESDGSLIKAAEHLAGALEKEEKEREHSE